MPNEPQSPKKLVGTKWTAVESVKRRKHWQVVEYRANEGVVTIEAVIDRYSVTLQWRDLRDRQDWLPGWI